MSGLHDLSPRLRMVADLVPTGIRLADVGTDHAYLPTALLQEGKIPFAVAADLRQGPLASAKATVRRAELEGKVAFRLCDGLRGIRPEEVDGVAIAGMGGETIASILAAAPWTRELDVPLFCSLCPLCRTCASGWGRTAIALSPRSCAGKEIAFTPLCWCGQARWSSRAPESCGRAKTETTLCGGRGLTSG